MRRARILIVDDTAETRRLLRESLRLRFCDVVGEAQDGPFALEQAVHLRCDRAIVDFSMPGLDGAETTRRLLAEHAGLEVVGFTSDLTAEAAFLRAGAVRCFHKTQLAELCEHVSRPL
jgi:DNA-binding NarL/FixJ family response regulator